MALLFLVGAVATLWCSTAEAVYSTTETESYSGVPNYSTALTFNQFDTQGGARPLVSIEVILNLQVTGGQYVLDNDGVDSAAGNFEFGGKSGITSTDVTLLNSLAQPVTGTASALHTSTFSLGANVGDGLGDYDPTPPDGMEYLGQTENDSKSGFIGPIFYNMGAKGFVGTGQYVITVDANQWSDYGSVGGIEYAVTPVGAGGTVTVIYNWTPEPATIGLLALGALFGFRRRRFA
jgi:hypothetical protein